MNTTPNGLSSRLFCGLSLLAVVILVGCGGGGDAPDRPDTVPVTGTVLLDGTPVADATVTFVPNSGQERGAVGKTDANGQYTLMTFEPGDGAIPGMFLVTVEKVEVIGGDQSDNGLAPPPEYKDQLPTRYKNPNSSGISREVAKDGENTLKLELTK